MQKHVFYIADMFWLQACYKVGNYNAAPFLEHAKENQSRLANQFEEERNKLLETITLLEHKLKQLETKPVEEPLTTSSDQQAGLMSTLSSAFGKKASAANQAGQKQQQKGEPPLDLSQQQVLTKQINEL